MTAIEPTCTGFETTGWRPLAPALAMLAASLLLLPGLAIRLPEAGAQVALVFSPGIPREQAIQGLAGMDARIVRAGGFDNVLIAQFERPVAWAELSALGVILPLDPIVAGGCAPRSAASVNRHTSSPAEGNET